MRLLCFTLMSAALLVTACGEAAAPRGENGTLAVRAYIDRDASGAFSTGDSALAGVSVALLANGNRVAEKSTGANGVAEFDDVAPGSYTLNAPPTAVSGGVLVSNPAPAAVISFQGGDMQSEFRYAFYPGEVVGTVFRDDNTNGVLDATDTRGGGLTVYLRTALGTVPGPKIDSVVTATDGNYKISRVAPGKYFVEFQNPTSISFGAAGAQRAITVAPRGSSSVPAIFSGSLVTTIADVRTRAVGANVAIQANITVLPGTFPVGTTANSEIWVQDASGGIAAINVLTADAALYALGDRVEVAGPTSLFNGQLQIATTSITRLGAGTVVAPKVLTISQANARTGGDEGRLITLNNVTVTTIGAGTAAAFNVTVRNTAGDTMVVRVNGLPTGLTRASFVVGNSYNVSGVLTQFNGVSQMKPRNAADLVAGGAGTPIAQVRAGTAGNTYTIEGNIIVAPGAIVSGTGSVNSEIWVQDATGGIAVFSALTADSLTLQLGDRVQVTGVLGAFSGQLQLSTNPVITRIAAGTAPAAKVITGTQMNAKTDDGLLVQVDNFTVATVGTGTAAAFNVTGTTPDGQTITIRVSGALTGLSRANFVVGAAYRVIGVLSQNANVAQIKVRIRSDINP